MIINGNLKFAGVGTGELQNAVMERLSTAARDSYTSPVAGQLIYNITTDTYNFYDGSVWVIFATGGDATALQNEVNAIETASGLIFKQTDGSFDGTLVDGALGNVTGSASLLDVLSQLDTAITTAAGVDTLTELTDVTVTAAAIDDMLVFTGSVWEDRTAVQVQDHLSLVPGTDVQVFDADLLEIAGLSKSIGDVLYSDGSNNWAVDQTGTTSGVQAWDAGLDSLAGLAAGVDALIYSTGTDAYATSSLTSYARTLLDDTDATTARATLGVVIGTDVQAFDIDLAEIAALTNATGDLLYTNGSGNWANAAAGSTSGVQAWDINLDEIANLTPLDSNFIVGDGTNWIAETGATVRTSLDVYSTTEADNAFVDVTGDTMSGNLNMGTNSILSLATPTSDTDAVNKIYVDSLVNGLTWKNSVVVSSEVGVNIDLATGGAITVDGILTVVGDRVLVQDQTLPEQNGIYIVVAGTWTRAEDFDSISPIDEINSAAVFVEKGTARADTGWTVTSNVAVVDTDAITFTQFNGAAGTVAGIGLVKTGNIIDVNMGAGIVALPSDEVGIDLYEAFALHLTEDGSGDSVGTAGQLALFIDGTTLTQSAAGIKVPAQGITGTELNASVAGDGLVGGAGVALAVNVDDTTVELVSDAVQVKDLGITNAKLANPSITMAADAGTADAVNLGETFTVSGGTLATTSVTANTITVNVALSANDLGDVDTTSTTPTTGDALVWDGSNWTPSNPINSTVELTDVTASASAAGQILVSDGTDYTPAKIHHVYTGASSLTHVVAHTLGQQFVNVTVVDGSDAVIIPQSITMDNANQLTVTFNTAIDCKVIVTGVAGV